MFTFVYVGKGGGPRLALWASAWPHGAYMTVQKEGAPSLRGLKPVFNQFMVKKWVFQPPFN